MHITVSVRSVYGNDLVYPADDQATLFARLINAKTFNAGQIETIRALGYAVHVASGRIAGWLRADPAGTDRNWTQGPVHDPDAEVVTGNAHPLRRVACHGCTGYGPCTHGEETVHDSDQEQPRSDRDQRQRLPRRAPFGQRVAG